MALGIIGQVGEPRMTVQSVVRLLSVVALLFCLETTCFPQISYSDEILGVYNNCYTPITFYIKPTSAKWWSAALDVDSGGYVGVTLVSDDTYDIVIRQRWPKYRVDLQSTKLNLRGIAQAGGTFTDTLVAVSAAVYQNGRWRLTTPHRDSKLIFLEADGITVKLFFEDEEEAGNIDPPRPPVK